MVTGIALIYGGLELWDEIHGHAEIVRLIVIVLIALYSFVLGFVMRRITFDANQAFLVGVVYLIFIAFMVSLTRHSVDPTEGVLRGWSMAAVLAVLFPVLVPCTPRRAAFSAIAVFWAALAAFGVALLTGIPFKGFEVELRGFLGELAAIPTAAFVSSVVYGLGRQLESARRMGAYELETRLGAGGMGEVWRGKHSMLARPAAIKLIRADALQVSGEGRTEMLQRFEREAQVTATLQCPHTVRVFDFGISDDGTFYYVMELLDGIDLHDLVVQHGPLPAERVVALLKQACRSLSEAHARGMVHRDIKPANMVVCRLGEDVDFVKILDFGLVTPCRLESEDSRLTTVGQFTGTAAFVSPEQGRDDLDIDGRSDLYGLGCVAYWLLTGQLVFEGTVMEMVASHMKEEPRPVSIATLTPIPERVEQIVMSCLEKDPTDRPISARALLEELEGIELERSWTEDRALTWWLNYEAAKRANA